MLILHPKRLDTLFIDLERPDRSMELAPEGGGIVTDAGLSCSTIYSEISEASALLDRQPVHSRTRIRIHRIPSILVVNPCHPSPKPSIRVLFHSLNPVLARPVHILTIRTPDSLRRPIPESENFSLTS